MILKTAEKESELLTRGQDIGQVHFCFFMDCDSVKIPNQFTGKDSSCQLTSLHTINITRNSVHYSYPRF